MNEAAYLMEMLGWFLAGGVVLAVAGVWLLRRI